MPTLEVVPEKDSMKKQAVLYIELPFLLTWMAAEASAFRWVVRSGSQLGNGSNGAGTAAVKLSF